MTTADLLTLTHQIADHWQPGASPEEILMVATLILRAIEKAKRREQMENVVDMREARQWRR